MKIGNRHSRRGSPYVSFYANEDGNFFGIYLEVKNYMSPKSKLYNMKKKIINGKIELPIPNKDFNIRGSFMFSVTDDNKLEYLYKL